MLTGMIDNDNNLNEAMFPSWDKKKKEYQDEIRRLNKELAECRKNLDKVQKKVISGNVKW
jgi:hypothetical protein